mgnify:CR=1 FL=1
MRHLRRIVWIKVRALAAKFVPVVPGILVVVFLCHQSSIKRLHFDDTRRRPRISWRETLLVVTPHSLQSILHTTSRPRLQLIRNCSARSARVRSSYRCCDAKMSFQNVPSCLISSMSAGSHCTSSSSFWASQRSSEWISGSATGSSDSPSVQI